jgi:hypothetical protein
MMGIQTSLRPASREDEKKEKEEKLEEYVSINSQQRKK